jgi:hypothetical protein
MNSDQILSLLRTILKFLGGYLVSAGFTNPTGMESIVGGVLAVIAAGWSWYTHASAPITVPPDTSSGK